MASIVYELAKHPEHIDKLRNELAPLVRDSNLDPSPDELAHLEHLNAVINETLRLHPPVPTTIWRVTPPGGVMIGDVHVPGGMNVTCPQYAVGRSKLAMFISQVSLAIACRRQLLTLLYTIRRSRVFKSRLVRSGTLVPVPGDDQGQGCVCSLFDGLVMPQMCSQEGIILTSLVHRPVWLHWKAAGTDGHSSGDFKAGLGL